MRLSVRPKGRTCTLPTEGNIRKATARRKTAVTYGRPLGPSANPDACRDDLHIRELVKKGQRNMTGEG